MEKTREKAWRHLYQEWSKIYDLIYAYDRILKAIEIKNNRYNSGFQLLLDSIVRNIVVTVDLFFQNEKKYWSLYSLDKKRKFKEKINKIKKELGFCIKLRNEHFSHLPQNIEQKGNYMFLNEVAVKKIEKCCEDINDVLISIGRSEGKDESYAMGFIGVKEEIDLIISDLEK